ncbi:MAG: class I mannose-6-phosphate isomerase [Anaerolineaceae bacterium]|nr:class I mannose-6-phosphate isomerase [Anaerolineaceae bacterium]
MDGGPLLLQPALKVKVWGGRKLEAAGIPLPDDQPYGEAWVMHDSATVAEGPLAGRELGELLPQYGAALAGPEVDLGEGWPLLAKLLDASAWLSLQVHPDDAWAQRLENEPRGKTEAWYVVAAEPDARLVRGLQPGCTREQLAAAIRADTLPQLLLETPVRPGDALMLPAGTLHALGPGLLVYEIQQTSDRTYRLYDWGRRGLDGQPRPLHIERGLMVANMDKPAPLQHHGGRQEQVVELARCAYFVCELLQLNPRAGDRLRRDTAGRRFQALTCIAGQATLACGPGELALRAGRTALVPACAGVWELRGVAQLLLARQP